MAEEKKNEKTPQTETRINEEKSSYATPSPKASEAQSNASEDKEQKRIPKKGLHTYAGDMAEVLRKKEHRGAFIKTAISEQRQKEQEMLSRSLKSKQNMFFVIGGSLLLIASISLILFFVISKRGVVIPQKSSEVQPLIFADTNKEINITDLSRESMVNSIQRELRNRQLESGTIENLYITESVPTGKILVTPSRFLSAIGSTPPSILLQSLDRKFMVGVHSQETNQLFILFTTSLYFNAFQGMLDWEERMFDELYLLFNIDVSGENQELFNKKFEGTFIKNKDAQVIKNAQEEIVLLYLFIDRQTIIITGGTDALDEVIGRLSIQQIRR